MIKLSPSSLAFFFTSQCPAAWDFSRKLQYIGPTRPKDESMDRGTLVHSMMEGIVNRDDVTDQKAVRFYDKLDAARKRYVLIPKAKELWQEFTIIPGVQWRRKIDFLGTGLNKDIIVDWKTAGGVWKNIKSSSGIVTPQAMGLQGIGYLVPPPRVKTWPTQIWFVVAAYRGEAEIFRYTYNKEDHENLIEAIRWVKLCLTKSDTMPKVRGYHCHNCDYRDPCFDVPGWKENFESKESKKPV